MCSSVAEVNNCFYLGVEAVFNWNLAENFVYIETLHVILILTAVVRHFSPRLWAVG